MGELNREDISHILIPIRNFEHSAKSREYHDKKAGGLMGGARDWKQQVTIYNGYIARYIQDMVKYDLKTIFIDFIKMTTDYKYLYDTLKDTFGRDISLEFFRECYEKADTHQTRRTIEK